jgi:two-component system chemotaxis response regulator CheY
MENRKVSVLIADDEEHIRSLIKLIIGSMNAEVVAEAADGEQALKLYQQYRPDMVILDINMPKLDGISVLKEIMKINSNALVVMLTSLNALDVVRECVDNGAWNYILKNSSATELLNEITQSWSSYAAEIEARKLS